MQKQKFNLLRFAAVGIALCLCIFIACENDTGGNGNTENETGNETGNETESTRVRFNNLEQYKVTVYRDSLRQNVFAEVAALGSTVVAATPSASGTVFYPTFNLELFDMPGIGVPYNAPGIVTTIAENSTTDVPIPKLEAIDTGTAFIKVINNSSYSLSFRQGGTEINLLGASYGVINANRSNVYEVAPGLVSGYSLMRNTTIPIDFPADLTEFKRGIIYVFTYNGTSLTLTQIKPSSASIGIIVPGNGLYEKLTWLRTNAESNNVYTVEINTNENIGPQTLGYSGKSCVTITMNGIGEMRTVNLSAQGALFSISSGVTLILDNNITLNGMSGNYDSLVRIGSGSTMIMKAGTKITGNTAAFSTSSHYNGGGVNVNYGGTFTMNGGTISGNSATYGDYYGGGGVYVGGTFTMNGGTISSNESGNDGGGVLIVEGIFTMAGGEISNNDASSGGGVYTSGTFHMSGGVIYGNNTTAGIGNLSSRGSALYRYDGTQAQYGTFSGQTFYPSGNLDTTHITIRVVNGNLLTE